MTVGTTLAELSAFTDAAVALDGEDGDDDPSIGGGGGRKKSLAGSGRASGGRPNALGAYLNVARQTAETLRKADEALHADRAIFSRQQNLLLQSSQQNASKKKRTNAHREEEDGEEESGQRKGGKKMLR